jgi:hypothetical protein
LVRRSWDVDRFWLAPAGTREVDFVSSLLQGWIIDKLTRSPNFRADPTTVDHRRRRSSRADRFAMN